MKVYGIRHHGPGSALNLQEALIQQKPDIILIEGPSDAQSALELLNVQDVSPPIALSALDNKRKEIKSWYPFALFSPEWIAILYGKKNDIPIRFIDLPSDQMGDDAITDRDPLKTLAKASGYTDTENWWEVYFENADQKDIIFDQVIELISATREMIPSKREVFMCNQIKAASKSYSNLAVVCGAWHAPILLDYQNHFNSKIKLLKSSHNYYWIPWSYKKLSVTSGYGAGIHAPLYYECIFQYKKNATSAWLAMAGDWLRHSGFQLSPAQLIDTSHLAINLAHLRNKLQPGLDELWDGIQTVLPDNKVETIRALREAIFIGTNRGRVSAAINDLPILDDFQQQLSFFRLKNVVDDPSAKVRTLDIRKERHLKQNQFFYQLDILGVPWPSKTEVEVAHLGHYFFYWELSWRDGIDSQLIEHAHRGPTILSAARDRIKEKIGQLKDASEVWHILNQSLFAGLEDEAPLIMQTGRDLLTESSDGFVYLKSWHAIHDLMAFGDIFQLQEKPLQKILEWLEPKICLLLADTFDTLDEENLDHACYLTLAFHTEVYQKIEAWKHTLLSISERIDLPPKMMGLSTRLLFDYADESETHQKLTYEFSLNKGLQSTAEWLEGFLMPGKLEFFQGSDLMSEVDHWLSGLDDEHFKDLLFGLRRSFNSFTSEEKVRLLEHVTGRSSLNPTNDKSDVIEVDSPFYEMWKKILIKGKK